VEREAALGLLPETYGVALRLRDQGLDENGIARALGVPREAVGPFLALADAKLGQLLRSRDVEEAGQRESRRPEHHVREQQPSAAPDADPTERLGSEFNTTAGGDQRA
jgi:hypothetical protein